MRNSRPHPQAPLQGVRRDLGGVILPAALALGLFALVPQDSRSQGESSPRREKPQTAELCGQWHRGSGETVALDLPRVRKAYESLKSRLERSLQLPKPEAETDLKRPYDQGLPACREEGKRTVKLSAGKGDRLRGKSIYFLSVSDPARAELPPEVVKDTSALILLVRVRNLEDLPEIARRLGRPVSLGGAEFAKSLGVRCSNTWVKLSEKGDALDLYEIR